MNPFGKSSTKTSRLLSLHSNTERYRDDWNRNCENVSFWFSLNIILSSWLSALCRTYSTSTTPTHSLIEYPNPLAMTLRVDVFPQPLGPVINKMGPKHFFRFVSAKWNQFSNSTIFLAWMARSSLLRGAKFSIQLDDLKSGSIKGTIEW